VLTKNGVTADALMSSRKSNNGEVVEISSDDGQPKGARQKKDKRKKHKNKIKNKLQSQSVTTPA